MFVYNKSIMKKYITFIVLAILSVSYSYAQLSIPGKVFADNPTRFNGRKVSLKEVIISTESNLGSNSAVIAPAPLNSPISARPIVAPGPRQSIQTCRPPRGFKEIDIIFKEAPEYKACFFMADPMYDQLNRELGGQSVDAVITFRGDSRTGYNLTFYKLGK